MLTRSTMVFSWRHHQVNSAFDSEKPGACEMERVYLGDGGIAEVVVAALSASAA